MPASPSPADRAARSLFRAGAIALLLARSLCAQAPSVGTPAVGPAHGSLIVAGGGELDREIWERFILLAGGEAARIVVIPTAARDDELPDGWRGHDQLRATGIRNFVTLHTRDPEEAGAESFVQPLREASGVWLPGGRPWRLVDAYLHTLVHEELFLLLERGGVVGGTSAGASIQASLLIRGDRTTNRVVFSRDYPEGFGLLEQVAVDQHLSARGREEDLWQVLGLHPDLLGIGLDEGTALVIQGNRAEVMGGGEVLIYDATLPTLEAHRLARGAIFDLGARVPIEGHDPEEVGIRLPSADDR